MQRPSLTLEPENRVSGFLCAKMSTRKNSVNNILPFPLCNIFGKRNLYFQPRSYAGFSSFRLVSSREGGSVNLDFLSFLFNEEILTDFHLTGDEPSLSVLMLCARSKCRRSFSYHTKMKDFGYFRVFCPFSRANSEKCIEYGK